jgi:small GTP-binding protein
MSLPSAFKIVFCGDSAVGKTSIVHRYCFNSFTHQMMATMGADFVSQRVRVSDGEVTLQIWDTAGQEQYHAIGPLFYRGAALAVVVYAVSDDRPLDTVLGWIDRMHDAEAMAKIVVFGNKVDLVPHPTTEVMEWCGGHQIQHFFCSARTGDGLKEAFQGVATVLCAGRPPPRLGELPPVEPASGCC